MQRLILGTLCVVGLAATWSFPAGVMFFQQPSTTKRGGTLPLVDEIPPIVGRPDTTQQDLELQQLREQEQMFYLEQLYQKRLEQNRVQAKAPASREAGAEVSPADSPASPPPPAAPTRPPASKPKQPGVNLTFSNAPIKTVINAIMKELGYSYVIDPQVDGTVNIFTMGDIPRDELFGVLEQLLKMNGQAIIRQQDLYVIVPIGSSPKIPHQILVKPEPRGSPSEPVSPGEAESAAEPEPPQNSAPAPPPEGGAAPQGAALASAPPAQPESSPTALPVSQAAEAQQLEGEQGIITYIIPLHYIPSSEMVTMVQPFVSDGATVIDFQSANILLITDYRRNIQQVLNLVSLLDTQYFDINTVDLVPIRYNQAKDVAEDLGKIFAPGDKAGGVRLVAVERLNSLLVVTHSPAVFQEVMKWVAKLDAPSTTSNIKTYVYQVENNTAMNIAEILAQLYQDGFGLPSSVGESREEGAAGVAPGAATREPVGRPLREPGFTSRYDQQFGVGGFGQAGLGAGGFGGGLMRGELGPSLLGRPNASQSQVRAVVAGNVKIVVNEFNNSLIIQATEADYQFLLQTIKQLDILPRQVLLEAKIFSVELRDELSFGVAAFLQKRGVLPDTDGDKGTSSGNQPATTGRISSTGQFSLTTRAFISQERELQAIINALRSKTDVEIVEAPRLLAVDGMQARINIGAEVPVTNASFGDPLRSGSTSFINSISFRPTGTTLLLVPRISASGIVTMDLAIEVSSATGAALTPTINRNYVETSLLVRDGQTIAIAGLISDQSNVGRKRVPVLGDIPIVGALFGQTTTTKRRQELIFFITPHVIRSIPTATELTLEFKRALRNAYDFIELQEKWEKDLIDERRQKELQEEK